MEEGISMVELELLIPNQQTSSKMALTTTSPKTLTCIALQDAHLGIYGNISSTSAALHIDFVTSHLVLLQ